MENKVDKPRDGQRLLNPWTHFGMQFSSSAEHCFSGTHTCAHIYTCTHTHTQPTINTTIPFFRTCHSRGAIACPAGRRPDWHRPWWPMPGNNRLGLAPQGTPPPEGWAISLQSELFCLLKSLQVKCFWTGFSFPEYSKMKHLNEVCKWTRQFLLKGWNPSSSVSGRKYKWPVDKQAIRWETMASPFPHHAGEDQRTKHANPLRGQGGGPQGQSGSTMVSWQADSHFGQNRKCIHPLTQVFWF